MDASARHPPFKPRTATSNRNRAHGAAAAAARVEEALVLRVRATLPCPRSPALPERPALLVALAIKWLSSASVPTATRRRPAPPPVLLLLLLLLHAIIPGTARALPRPGVLPAGHAGRPRVVANDADCWRLHKDALRA